MAIWGLMAIWGPSKHPCHLGVPFGGCHLGAIQTSTAPTGAIWGPSKHQQHQQVTTADPPTHLSFYRTTADGSAGYAVALNREAGVMRLADLRLPKCSTACNQNSAERFRRSRIGGESHGGHPNIHSTNKSPPQIPPTHLSFYRTTADGRADCAVALNREAGVIERANWGHPNIYSTNKLMAGQTVPWR
jgi:hypothetical protein